MLQPLVFSLAGQKVHAAAHVPCCPVMRLKHGSNMITTMTNAAT